ncbi:hypothetical protein D9M70_412170 [compost metagenome]
MEALHQLAVVEDVAIGGWVLQERTEVGTGVINLMLVTDDHLNTKGFSAGTQHIQRLRMAIAGSKERVAALVLRQTFAEGHRFRRSSTLIQQ